MAQTTIESNIQGLPTHWSNDEPRRILWTKSEYHQMAQIGLFLGKRTEFLKGEIIEMPTMNSPHATGLTLTDDALRSAFGSGFYVRSQMPLDFGPEFEPVPDLAVVRGTPRDYVGEHPTTAALIVEISDSTRRYDQDRKMSLYARFGIEDYWILNLRASSLEIYRGPIADERAFYGFTFEEVAKVFSGSLASPLAFPDARIDVADLLP